MLYDGIDGAAKDKQCDRPKHQAGNLCRRINEKRGEVSLQRIITGTARIFRIIFIRIIVFRSLLLFCLYCMPWASHPQRCQALHEKSIAEVFMYGRCSLSTASSLALYGTSPAQMPGQRMLESRAKSSFPMPQNSSNLACRSRISSS